MLFLATSRVLSLVEGRIIESFLGVRMPRRPTCDIGMLVLVMHGARGLGTMQGRIAKTLLVESGND
ncbi:MAG: hypothetical protein IIA98_06555 [Proteobacteria bacterium]|nr:hypothetical protein [Pseudomonadota bacterium]